MNPLFSFFILMAQKLSKVGNYFKGLVLGGDITFDTDNAYDIGDSSKGLAELHIALNLLLKTDPTKPNSLAIRSSANDGYNGLSTEIIYLRTLQTLSYVSGDNILIGNNVTVPSLPTLTTTERDLIGGIAGMIIYNSTLSKFQDYITDWQTRAYLNLAQTFTQIQSFSDNIKLALTKILYLDTDLDTYIYSNADDNISFYAGGQLLMRLITNNATIYKPLTLTGDLKFSVDDSSLIGSQTKGVDGIHLGQNDLFTEYIGRLCVRNSANNSFNPFGVGSLYVGELGQAQIMVNGNALRLSNNWNYAPRITNGTTTNRNELNGQGGMMYYDTTLSQLMAYVDAWYKISYLDKAQTFTAKQSFDSIELTGLTTLQATELVYIDGDETPTVAGINSLVVSNVGATNITDFDNGTEGQVIVIRFDDGNTTVIDGTNTFLSGGANKNFAQNQMLVLINRNGGLWYQIGGEI